MASAQPAAAAAHTPIEGRTRLWATLAISAATFMNVLDTSIANVSLPAIAGDLGVSPNQGTWVITSFAVANAIAVPLTGWLTQRLGQVRLMVASVLLFVIASLLCGLAPNMPMLIAFRVLQGFVAGPMIPLSQALLLQSYPREQAGRAMAAWAMTTLVAPVMGPLLGGWITDNIDWPWIFYINVPVGLLAAFFIWRIYHRRESPVRKLPIDRVGLALLVLWIAALQMVLDLGKEHDWFASPLITGLAVVAAVGFAFFIAWELTDEHPVVDLKLFQRRNFWAGTLATSVAYGLFFGNVVLLPLWLQQYMGYTATDAGMVTAPVGLLAIVLSPFVGATVARVDPRRYVTFAFGVFALVMLLRSHFSTQADFATILVPTIVQGVAMAFFFVPLNTLTLSGLAPDRIPAAAGLSNFVRITFGAVGTSVATTVWESRATLHHTQLAEAVNLGSPATQATLAQLMGGGMTQQQALAAIDRLVQQQAFTLAATDIFWLSSMLFLALIPLVWLTRAPQRQGPASAAAAEAAAGAH
ncbi:DHA2 family efflux MFS transporter permease subunit [Hydrogenophaga crocea]|uniref:DHA2 family efflux MFS transporter permease subunit n=1 Tax=Hydrogenophaga crocea TaxID=2716225 RepID=A0A6G8IK32_9BURK|nr:DHA2 family efflux MFS transporter permease subunit [Hydrogenophaga crocea]QIM53602.1 DHA2 family efflux MFS transporter permease subunit [Hydrogenophaga crocea]